MAEYATCRKCGDPIERGSPRLTWCSLRGQAWPRSCSRPWWRAAQPHEPGEVILTGEAAQAARRLALAFPAARRKWQLRRVWEG